MKLCFVRHGESEANVRRIISNRESPFGLTSLGRQQAKTLAANLMGLPITSIYSSPVRRAMETAEILSQAFCLPYQITEALREYDCGILEDQSDDESWKLHREISEDWLLHQNYLRKPEGGECFLDIQKRFVPFLEGLTRSGSTEDHVLAVGHGGLFQLMLPLVLANIDVAFVRAHGIGHTDCIVAERGQDGWTCLQWGPSALEKR